MKNLIIFLIIFVTYAYAQKVTILHSDETKIKFRISFDDIVFPTNDYNILKFVDESKPGEIVLPKIVKIFAIPSNSKVSLSTFYEKEKIIQKFRPSLNPQITLNSDSVITYTDIKNVKSYNKKKEIKSVEISSYIWLKDYYCVAVQFNPFEYAKDGSGLKIISEGEYEISFSGVSNVILNRSKKTHDKNLQQIISNYTYASDFFSKNRVQENIKFNNDWIDYSQKYLKIKIEKNGIYRINYDDLNNLGIKVNSIIPEQIKLYNKGKEIPIFVRGEFDNSFDELDFIEFYATKNINGNYKVKSTKDEEYINYFDKYTDATYLWVEFGGNSGKRIKIQNIFKNTLIDTLDYSLSIIHLEKDLRFTYYDGFNPKVQMPNWKNHKFWSWYASWQIRNKNINYFIDNAVEGTKLNTFIRAVGSYAPSGNSIKVHKLGVSNNNIEADTTLFDLHEVINFESEFSFSSIQKGINNLNLKSISTGLSPEGFEFDWAEISYNRNNVAEYHPSSNFSDDSLKLIVPKNINNKEIIVKSIGFSEDSIIVYKTFPKLKKINNYKVSFSNNFSILFSDTISTSDEYFLTTKASVIKPKFISYKEFSKDLINNNAEYLIISAEELRPSVNKYLDFINESYNLPASLFFIQEIYNQFGFGYPEPESIKNFLRYSSNEWGNVSPSFVNLIGEANYDYKSQWQNKPAKEIPNLVPSYGVPVSDSWFVMWDTVDVNLQQMSIGRIPAKNNGEVNNYLEKHKTYINQKYSDFNKRALLFSGGDPHKSNEIASLKNANDRVASIIASSALKGVVKHFYKTIIPKSNFGPFSFEEISSEVDSGGVYISYIGHSGTQTWDNGIVSYPQLSNKVNNFSLISDFGCSTGKFAEPDVTSFSELFTSASNDGTSIAYVGNSSLGYLSTATRVPSLFTELLLENDSLSIGEIHNLLKYKNFELGGVSDLTKLFNLSNVLIGDPIIRIRFPQNPNLTINNSSIQILSQEITENLDSIDVLVLIKNNGKVTNDSINITIKDIYNGSVKFTKDILLVQPHYKDTLFVKIPINKLLGQHKFEIELDSNNEVEEIYEYDNFASIEYNVVSNTSRSLTSERFYNSNIKKIKILNQTLNPNINSLLRIQIDTSSTFSNANSFVIETDTLYSVFELPFKEDNKRYWWRTASQNSNLSLKNSFTNTKSSYNWYFNEAITNVKKNNVEFIDNVWGIVNSKNKLKIYSAGLEDGGSAIIEYNGHDYIGDLLWGMATAILDPISLEPLSVRIFKSGGKFLGDTLGSYINGLESGTILAMSIGIEARNYILGHGENTVARNAIKTLGSIYADSIGYRESWSIIGVKGAAPGTVLEKYSPRLAGPAIVDTFTVTKNKSGWLKLPEISNVNKWDSLKIQTVTSELKYLTITPIGKKMNGIEDTLKSLEISKKVVSLEEINAKIYPRISFLVNMKSINDSVSPSIQSISVKYKSVPELAINYQVVSIEQDTLEQGKDANLSFFVYNVGESTADSFKVKVEVIKPDNSKEKIFEQIVDSLGAEKRKQFKVAYNTKNFNGARIFSISIDTEDKIIELYEDNNFYTIPFYVKGDTTKPTLTLTVDGNDIFEGEYISSTPKIKIEMSEPSPLPIKDTSSVNLFLNNKRISYKGNEDVISISYSQSNPKVIVDFAPQLEDGEYELKIFGKDASGNVVDPSGISKSFVVASDAKIMEIYNYPNPMTDETYFTFKLTQIPDEVKIRIFTIAGRMIKEIVVDSGKLNFDLNKIYWNGLDADGDEIGNGVYIYKVIMDVNGEKQVETKKLAIVR